MLKGENWVRERTNRNDHPRITVYNRTYWKIPADSPYCGSSVDWAIRQAGWKHDIALATMARYWAQKKQYIVWNRYGGPTIRPDGRPMKPQRNDVVVFYQSGFWHIGLLEDWMEGSVHCKTVEGNTSDRGVLTVKKPTGKQGVYDEKIRNKKDIYCIVRPYIF
ncbi:hypothetical protein GCM10023189_43060 [Nibrella saemangeumensis]|uniref:Peptidase C51 domain-containing protein n=1 Tax=Nibrella saemangeumensis TaxID=1084526 RepID=A0ABP8NDT8_9BACT